MTCWNRMLYCGAMTTEFSEIQTLRAREQALLDERNALNGRIHAIRASIRELGGETQTRVEKTRPVEHASIAAGVEAVLRQTKFALRTRALADAVMGRESKFNERAACYTAADRLRKRGLVVKTPGGWTWA